MQTLFTIKVTKKTPNATPVNLIAVCDTADTRNGYKHVATLPYQAGGPCAVETKICYQGRTWERFQYESVLEKLIDIFHEKTENTYTAEIIRG